MWRNRMIKDSRSCNPMQIPPCCHLLSVLSKDQDDMVTWSSLWSSDFCTWLWPIIPSKQKPRIAEDLIVNENLLPELHHRRCSIHRQPGPVRLSIVGVYHQTRFWNQPKWWGLKRCTNQSFKPWYYEMRFLSDTLIEGFKLDDKLPVFHVLLQVAQGSVAEKEENR